MEFLEHYLLKKDQEQWSWLVH